MICRVTDRTTFSQFRHAARARSGPLDVRFVPPLVLPSPAREPARAQTASELPVQVAYAIGRPVGNAVARNRARRRLRAVMSELDRAGRLAPGAYLISAAPAVSGLSHGELVGALGDAATRAAAAVRVGAAIAEERN